MAIFVWLIMPGVDFFLWRQVSEVDFNIEAGSGGNFNMEAVSGGSFQYGGGFRGQIYLWRRISDSFVLLGVY
jgi:hypothetical protein